MSSQIQANNSMNQNVDTRTSQSDMAMLLAQFANAAIHRAHEAVSGWAEWAASPATGDCS
jgi:hypothetical protein